jgi:O-antigen/teichoic acid export membrane protein
MALAHASLTWLAIAYTLETVVALAVSAWMFWRYPVRRPSRDELAHLLGYARPMFLVTTLAYILPNIDRILLERSWDAKEVGYYTAVLGLVALLQRVPLAAMGIFLPQASEDAARGDLREVQRRLFILERYLLMITVPMCVAVALASAHVTRLYLGQEFARSGPILAVLALSPLLTAFFEPYNTVVYAIEKHQYLVLSGVLSLVVLLIVDALLVPPALWGMAMMGLGGLGAALGSLISQAVNGTLQVYIARRFARVGLYGRAVRFVTAGLAMAATAMALRSITNSDSLLVMALGLVGGGMVYLIALALQHEFSLADARLFLELLHPGRMARYIGAELQNATEQEPPDRARL